MVQFPPGKGMIVVWLELIRLPSLLAAYQGFIILSLLQQGRGGVRVCVCSRSCTAEEPSS